MRNLALAVSMGLMAACGPLKQIGPLPVVSAFGLGGQGDGAAVLEREVATTAVPHDAASILLFGVVSDEREGVLEFEVQNGKTIVWRTTAGVSVVTRNGIVVGTRGLGDDVLGAEISDVSIALERGAGEARRMYEHLDGEDHVVVSVYDCTYETLGRETIDVLGRTHLADIIGEVCRNTSRSFGNVYWRTDAGEVVQSRQWISSGTGYIDLQWR